MNITTTQSISTRHQCKSIVRSLICGLFVLPALLVSTNSFAQTIEVPVGQQGQQNSSVERPKSGL